jgi:Leucine-rich repeat (LRR) protein
MAHVQNNTLNGTLPSELYALSSLEDLSMVGGNLKGTIPSSIGKLIRLDRLQLAENRLTGTFPKSFSDLPRLKSIFLGLSEIVSPCDPIWDLDCYFSKDNLE